MRAEEGDETVEDYAAEGKQVLNRIKAVRGRTQLGRVARGFARLWRGEHGSRGDGPTG